MTECRKCGRCCSEKVIVGDEVFVTPYYCKYLDPDTRLCTVFNRRHLLDVDCLPVKQAVKARVFPADCPYVRDLSDYRPPRDDWWNNDQVRGLVEGGQLEGQLLPKKFTTEKK